MRAIRISWKSAQRLLGLAHNSDGYGKEAVELETALKPKKFVTLAKARKAVKRQTKKEKTTEIRAAVMKRAGGCCEYCRQPATQSRPLELDHFEGRARSETLESCWALCWFCHHNKTHNRPTRAAWLARFILHCRDHGYRQKAMQAGDKLEALELSEASSRAGGAQ